jgi:hypothetical protein
MPVVVFTSVFALLSFQLHFARPGFCWFLVVVAFLAVALCAAAAMQVMRKRKASNGIAEPSWIVFLTISCLVAWVLALVLGLWNYYSVMLPHYKLVTLNSYNNVDPSGALGSSVMDAGRLSFKAGSYIDTSKAIGFKKVDTYCVAPVVSTKTPSLTYDFWATGVNCCSGERGDFHCGEVWTSSSPMGSGRRVLNDADISWFTLATQQAEALYHIKVDHPIFFKSVSDPLADESKQMDRGVKFFCLWSLIFLGIQLFMVSFTLVMFSRTYY